MHTVARCNPSAMCSTRHPSRRPPSTTTPTLRRKGAPRPPCSRASRSWCARVCLCSVARCLHNSLEVISAPPVLSDEDSRAQLRRASVARRRELLSKLKEGEEAPKRADASRCDKEVDARRAKEDVRKRELERIHKIQVQRKQQDAEWYKAALVEKGILKAWRTCKLDRYPDISHLAQRQRFFHPI
ncbi:hypothetical protein C8F04DRAFT_346260 [Mycena alexandri]|uniref:Uncharacterized protein n=1 Tax=Mycena alexandri TaxID=1745969 RepID=A0AAD6TH31_9AGAR|nr:hypothetical protein C8F04DRAFT_346260 [Mycena alexandri]